MAKFTSKDPFTYQKERNSFLKDVYRFHAGRGTKYNSFPSIGGQEVDLYLLYNKVTQLGGWKKVNDEFRWEEIQGCFHVPPACINASQALKQIYIRYLSHYETAHFFGEDPDKRRDDHHVEGSHHRKKASGPLGGVPLQYNTGQHHLPDHIRRDLGLATAKDLVATTDYNNLEKALMSGFPNEVDVALNVCTLLSNEGRHTFKLDKCPRFLRLLLAHIGIYEEDHESFYTLHEQVWKKHSKRNYLKFWYSNVRDREARKYISPCSLNPPSPKLGCASPSSPEPCSSPEVEGGGIVQVTDSGGTEGEEELERLFNMDQDLGMHNAEGQRVLQLAMILRNLSFEKVNMKVLSSDLAVVRFLLLCINTDYNSLKQLAFDTLGNMALQMVLKPIRHPATQIMLRTLSHCIASPDKSEVVCGLDILSRLCQVEANEELLSDNLDEKLYEDIVRLLTVHDIQLIVYTLEALYQLSELGEVTATHIAAVKMAVETLVNLVTVEAQSYGPESLIGIKVVEHVTQVPVEGEQPAPPSQATIQQQMAAPQPVSQSQQHSLQTPQGQKPIAQNLRPAAHPTPVRPGVVTAHQVQRPSIVATPPPTTPSPAALTRAANQSLHGNLNQQMQTTPSLLKDKLELNSDTVAANWLQSNYIFIGTGPAFTGGNEVPKMELYGQYLTMCGQMGVKNIVNASSFASCVRITFPKVDNLKVKRPDGSLEQLYRGLKRRDQPLPFNPKTDNMIPKTVTDSSGTLGIARQPRPPPVNTACQGTMQSPPGSPTKIPKTSPLPSPIGTAQYPTIQQALLGPQGTQPLSPQQVNTGNQPAPNSTLIKSLLANKVNQNITRGAIVQNQPMAPSATAVSNNGNENQPQPFQTYQQMYNQNSNPGFSQSTSASSPETGKSAKKKRGNSPPGTPNAKTPTRSKNRSPRNKTPMVITATKDIEDILESVARQGSLDSDDDDIKKEETVIEGVKALSEEDTRDYTSNEPMVGVEESSDDKTELKSGVNNTPVTVNGTPLVNTVSNGSALIDNNSCHSSDNSSQKIVTETQEKKAPPVVVNGAFHHIGNGDCSKTITNSKKNLEALNNKMCDNSTLNSPAKGLLENNLTTGENSRDSGIKCDDRGSLEIDTEEAPSKGVVENGFASPSTEMDYEVPQLDGTMDTDGESTESQSSNTQGPAAQQITQVTSVPSGSSVQVVYSQAIPAQGHILQPGPTTMLPQQIPQASGAGIPVQHKVQASSAPGIVGSVAGPQVMSVMPPGVRGPAPVAQSSTLMPMPLSSLPTGSTITAADLPTNPSILSQPPAQPAQDPAHLQQLQLQQQQIQMQMQQLQQMAQQLQQQWLVGQQQLQSSVVVTSGTSTSPQIAVAATQQPNTIQILPKTQPHVQISPEQGSSPAPQISPNQVQILPKPQQQMVLQANQPTQPALTQQVISQNVSVQGSQAQVRLPVSVQQVTLQQAQANIAASQPQPAAALSMPNRFVVPQGQVAVPPGAMVMRPQMSTSVAQTRLVQPTAGQQTALQPQLIQQQIIQGQQQIIQGQASVSGQTQVVQQQVLQTGQQFVGQPGVQGQQVLQGKTVIAGQHVLTQGQIRASFPGQTLQGQPRVVQPGQAHQVLQQVRPQMVQQTQAGQVVQQQFIQQRPVLQPGQVLQSQPLVVQATHGQPQVQQIVAGQNIVHSPQVVSQTAHGQVVQQSQTTQLPAQTKMIQTQAQYIQRPHIVQASHYAQPVSSQTQVVKQGPGGTVTVMVQGQQGQMVQYTQAVGQALPTSNQPHIIHKVITIPQSSIAASNPMAVTAPTIQIPAMTPASTVSAPSSLSSNTPTPSPISTPPPPSPQQSKSSSLASPSSTTGSSKKKRPSRTPAGSDKSSKKKKPSKSRSSSTDSRPPSRSSECSQPVTSSGIYSCDWAGCKLLFDTMKEINRHVVKEHFEIQPSTTTCQWEGCDGMKRQKWSLMTHLQDRHLNENSLKSALLKRQQAAAAGSQAQAPSPAPAPTHTPQATVVITSNAPVATATTTSQASSSASNTPSYPDNAAIQAIKRFAVKPPFQELMEMKEGPVTKHLRLTSALILRNLARYSALARSKIKQHEHQLAYVAMSAVEASNPISSCLYELHH